MNYKIVIFFLILVFSISIASAGIFTTVSHNLNNYPTRKVLLGYLNDDDYLDIAESNNYFFPNRIYLGLGNGSFYETNQQLGNDSSYGFAMGDLDNDGDLDLIAGNNHRPNNIEGASNKVYLNDGLGNFTLHESSTEMDLTISIALGDIDDDGDLDYVSGCEDKVVVYQNNGSANFKLTQTIGNLNKVNSIALGDIDNDNHLDFIAGLEGNNRVYKNDGNGYFSQFQAFLVYDRTIDLRLLDVDGDDDLDVFAGNYRTEIQNGTNNSYYDYTNYAYKNDGSGQFTLYQNITEKDATFAVAYGDLDNDGDYDIISGTTAVHTYPNRIYDNNDSGYFTIIQNSTEYDYTYGLDIGDIDSDADLDYIAGTHAGPTLKEPNRIYINNESDTNPNNPPTVPSSLNANIVNRGVNLSWNSGSDIETPTNSLTYNVRVGKISGGNDIFSGVIKSGPGNVGHLKSKLLKKLKSGTYYWSVQTIDSGFMRSDWSDEETFLVTNHPPEIQPIADIYVNETDLIEIIVDATDEDNDDLTYSINDTRFRQNNNKFNWLPMYNDEGIYSVEVSVSDGEYSVEEDILIQVDNSRVVLTHSADYWLNQFNTIDNSVNGGMGYSNEKDAGRLAWDESLILNGYLAIYEAINDTSYLDKFVSHVDIMINNANDINNDGYLNWPYLAGDLYVTNDGFETPNGTDESTPENWVRFNGDNSTIFRDKTEFHWQSAGLTIITDSVVEREMYQELLDYRPIKPFTRHLFKVEFYGKVNDSDVIGNLSIYNEDTGETLVSVVFSNTEWEYLETEFFSPLDYSNRLTVRLGYESSPVGKVHFDDIWVKRYEENIILDAEISYPLVYFAKIINTNPSLNKYLPNATAYQAFVENNIVPKWEPNWRNFSSEAGSYIGYGKGEKYYNKSVPHNQYLHFANVLMQLYNITENPDYYNKINKMGNYFKSNLELNNDAYKWYYWGNASDWINTPGWGGVEDTSHANEDISAVLEMYHNNLVFDLSDMNRFVSTFMDVMWDWNLSYPGINTYVDARGSYHDVQKRYTPEWTELSEFDMSIEKIIETVYSTTSVNHEATSMYTIANIIKWHPGLNNSAPILNTIDNINATETDLITINAIASDPDNDPLTYSINDSRFDQNNNIFTWQTQLGDNGIYDVLVTVSDDYENDSQVVTITVKEKSDQLVFDLELVSGWNLISFPIIPDNNSLSSIMEGCDYNKIWEFQNDQSWKNTDIGLTSMDILHGYWIDRVGLTGSCTINVTGTEPDVTEISVTSGWTLVGFPSSTSQSLDDVIDGSLYDKIWEFQDDQSWKNTDIGLASFKPGKGYWIDGTTGGSYNVTY